MNLINKSDATKKGNRIVTRRLHSLMYKLIICIIIGVGIFASIYTSLSWYASNREVYGKGMSVKAGVEDLEGEFYVYAYDLSAQKATSSSLVKNSTTGEYEEVPNTVSNFDFNTHDAIFTELNKYTMALIQIDITGQQIINYDSGSIDIVINKQGNKTTSSSLERKTSNILTFQFLGISSSILNVTAGEGSTIVNEKWKKAKEILEDNPTTYTEQQMISKSGSTYTVEQSITFTFSYTASDIYLLNGNRTVTVFLAIDYCQDYVTDIIEQEGIGSDFENVIPISNDLDKIKMNVSDD